MAEVEQFKVNFAAVIANRDSVAEPIQSATISLSPSLSPPLLIQG